MDTSTWLLTPQQLLNEDWYSTRLITPQQLRGEDRYSYMDAPNSALYPAEPVAQHSTLSKF